MAITPTSIDSKTFIQPECCDLEVRNFPYQRALDTICRIALGVFSALYAPLPFLISFQIGLLAGTVYAISRLYQSKPMFPDGENKPVCAQGYMDFLSGMKFPPPAGTLATAVFIAAHTRHDPLFYAPFCGLFIGFWLGRQGTISGRDLTAHAFDSISIKTPEVKEAGCPCCVKI